MEDRICLTVFYDAIDLEEKWLRWLQITLLIVLNVLMVRYIIFYFPQLKTISFIAMQTFLPLLFCVFFIVATLLGFVVQLSQWKAGIGHGMAIIPLAGTIAVYFLELLVAFIQAFIFTFLSALFLSQMVMHHGEHHEEGHGEAHAAH